MHRITVVWPDTSFPTSEEAMRVTRMSLVDSAKALGVNEPNVEQFETRESPAPQTDVPTNETGTAVDDSFAETTDAMEWAKAFCQRFAGQIVGPGSGVDEGLMVGWFANAMGAGERKADGNARAKAEAEMENPS